MRVFFDTNVLVSAFTAHGTAERAFQLALLSHTVLTSEYVLGELRAKLSQKMKVPAAEVSFTLEYIRKVAEIVPAKGVAPKRSRDPKDDPVLHDAMSGGAGILVSGDKDLLSVTDLEGIAVISPRSWIELHTQ